MSARMVIRDVARVLDVPYAEADILAKMIPNELHITIKKALEQNRELNEKYELDQETKRLLDIAMALEGMPRQASTHACRYSYYKRTSSRLCSTICKPKRWSNFNTIHNDNSRRTRVIKNGLFRITYINSYTRCNKPCKRT